MVQRRELRDLLEQQKLKKTSQRALIWGALVEAKGHPSVEQIHELLIKNGHRIGMATIYRTLKILLASGYIRQSKMHGTTSYEPVVGQPNHLHFICNSCGSNVEFPSRKVEGLIKQVTEEFGFEERYSRYAIFGLCKSCARKEAKAAGMNEKRRQQKTIVRDALELTLAIERRGYTFYSNAARKTKDDRGRLMFQRLAAEESEHLQRLQKEYRTLMAESPWLKQEPARLPVSRRIADEIFPQKELLKIEVKDQTTDLEALNLAMDLERRSHRFFMDFAKQIADPGGRKIFLEFAEDEDSHLQALLSEYESIVSKQSM
jgi:Fur family transcriptional regulator, ferric uptake regulator